MPFEPTVIIKPSPTKPASRPNTRATLRDLNSSRDLRVFRRQSLLKRLVQFFTGSRDDAS
jgi:hypothetical protein